MSQADLILSSHRVVTPEGVRPAAVVASRGRVEAVLPPEEAPDARRRLDVEDAVVMPGLVDVHVHVNEPGRTDWEGFETAGAAAAAGGVTTLVDMPLNSSPVTTTAAALEAKVEAARGACRVDFGLWGGLVPESADRVNELLEAGALGCKCFLVDSGIDEFPPVDEEALRRGMPALAARGAPLLVHAELPGPIEAAAGAIGWTLGSAAEEPEAGEPASGAAAAAPDSPAGPRSYAAYLASRPPAAEVEAVELLMRLAAETGARVHVVHVSAAEALTAIDRARAAGPVVTCETCPHYLSFVAEEIPDGATQFKCAPPIRGRTNRERLWEALGAGRIDLVASDHSSCPPELKCSESGDFRRAWGGIASLELTLPAVWTEASRRGHGLEDLARWLCEAPARLAGLEERKGRIAPGADADLIVWDPDAAFTVDAARLRQRHPATPYAGRTLRGRVSHAFVRGTPVVENGELTGLRPGRWLRSGTGVDAG